MEAKNFRVGNYAIYDDIICEILDISLMDSTDYWSLIKYGNQYSSGIMTEALEPIPFKAEWLDKFKWQLVKGNIYCINSYFNIDIYGHLYYRSDYTGINIDYIHELQNWVFAIKKTEIELKNVTEH